MKLVVTGIAVIGMAGLTLPAVASDDLAKKHACFACHTVDKKMVGVERTQAAEPGVTLFR